MKENVSDARSTALNINAAPNNFVAGPELSRLISPKPVVVMTVTVK